MFVSISLHDDPYTTNHTQGTTFLGLSLRSEGYSVWANAEASGTVNDKVASDANTRMAAAGIQIVSLFSIICELMRDWRSDPGALQVLPWLDQ